MEDEVETDRSAFHHLEGQIIPRCTGPSAEGFVRTPGIEVEE